MVKVREDQPVHTDGSINIDAWLDRLSEQVTLRDRDLVRDACEWSQDVRHHEGVGTDTWGKESGFDCFHVGLEMAGILAELRLDQDSLVAAILYRAVREHKLDLEKVSQHFGKPVAKLITDVQGMAVISGNTGGRTQVLDQRQDQLDKVRKMLVSIIDDVRVALIKLSERTCAIRAVKNVDKEKRRRVAREVFEIYAPLAHRLGIGYIKWELEDLSFRYLKPQDYKKIARLLDEKRLDREQYINDVVASLEDSLGGAGIKADVTGRAKHIYSIWRKMRRKGLEFRELYDIRAVRILVPEIRDCYASLGIVHSLWSHIPKEFDDYIATPKENGYRSLHTAVLGPEGKTVEVQIRTHAMHEEAELGVCAHWKYKGTDVNSKSDSYEEKIAWLRQVMEWHEELGDLDGLPDQWRADVEPDRIYVFTKDGHVVDLPTGATPIDFAFRIHSEVGRKCRGAKVNGRIVPLNHTLKTGAQVEILTASNAMPSRDWMNPNLGYVTTSRARAKITNWFKKQDHDFNEANGRRMIEEELKRLALTDVNLDELAVQVNYKDPGDMFAAVGAGDLRTAHVINTAQRLLEPEQKTEEIPRFRQRAELRPEGDISIYGVGNLMTQMAKCCHPLPGDPIVGYITMGRGVTIHRQDCANALQLQEQEAHRMIEVSWGHDLAETYPVEVLIQAYDRPGLLRDITLLLANEKINVLSLSTRTSKEANLANMVLTIAVTDLTLLGRVLAKIMQLPNVIDAVRYRKTEVQEE